MTFGECWYALREIIPSGVIKLEVHVWRYEHDKSEQKLQWEIWISALNRQVLAFGPDELIENVKVALLNLPEVSTNEVQL